MKLSELKTRDHIGYVLDAMGLTGTGAEIGVAFGENAEVILDGSCLENLLLVDPWDDVPGQDQRGFGGAIKDWHGCFCYCSGKLSRFGDRAKFVRMSSYDAAKTVADESLDFVYIDGNHMSPYVDDDLRMWYPKVKPGGIFGGHDYYDRVQLPVFLCDVKSAVDRFFSDKSETIHIVPDETPSWYTIKES